MSSDCSKEWLSHKARDSIRNNLGFCLFFFAVELILLDLRFAKSAEQSNVYSLDTKSVNLMNHG